VTDESCKCRPYDGAEQASTALLLGCCLVSVIDLNVRGKLGDEGIQLLQRKRRV